MRWWGLLLPGLVKLCSGKEIRMSLRGIGPKLEHLGYALFTVHWLAD